VSPQVRPKGAPYYTSQVKPEVGLGQQQQQLKKLGIIIHYLDKFNHNWSLHTPRALGQTVLQSEPLERASLLPGLSPGYVWHIAIQLLFA